MVDRGRTILGVILIAAGVIFLLDVADIVPAGDLFRNWWPVVFVVLGMIALFGRQRSWMGGGALIVIGLVLLTSTLDLIDVPIWQLLIPLVLIAIGLNVLLRGLGRDGTRDTSDRANIVSVLSEQRIVSDARSFKRANITSVLGEATLDLRKARIDPGGTTVDVFCALGDAVVLVPRGWRIHVNGMPILAEFDDETDRSVEVAPEAPEISVTGVAVLADVKVKHER